MRREVSRKRRAAPRGSAGSPIGRDQTTRETAKPPTRKPRPGLGLLVFVAVVGAVACGESSDRASEARTSEGEAVPEAVEEVGRLVLVGGALEDDNDDVYDAILEGREGEGPLCVLPTASGRPRASMEGYVSTFDHHGGAGTARGVFLTTDNAGVAASPDTARALRDCSGFFFTGGSQSRIADVFLPGGDTTAAFRAVRDRFLEGATVSGSSAGAAVLSEPMIAGGSSRGALADGLRASEDGDGVWLRRGFGFFGPGIVDQHFLARGRIARLLVAVVGTPEVDWGFGIDENTGLVVDGSRARVLGASGVVWVDGSEAVPEVNGTGATDLRLHLLGAGDVVDLADGTVAVAEDKAPPEADEAGVEVPRDPFGEWSFLRLLADLAASPDAEAGFTVAGYRFDLEEGESYRARAYGPGGPRNTPLGLYSGPLQLGVARR